MNQMDKIIHIRSVDHLRVASIVDNNADRSFRTEGEKNIVSRFQFPKEMYDGILPFAEHGFSMLLKTKIGEDEACVLVDAGVSQKGFVNNIRALNINPHKVNEVVITHGHADHFLGLPALATEFGLRGIKVIVHPAAFNQRKFAEATDGPFVMLKTIDERKLEAIGFTIETNEKPVVLGNKMMIASGAVPRDAKYDNALPFHYSNYSDGWRPDPSVIDDQFVIVKVKGQGLVVVTGCGHSGLINIIRYAQNITGEEKILAVFGGFHLYQNPYDSKTYKALRDINPKYIIPTHCTGWRDTHLIAARFPEKFIQNSVGTVYSFSE